MLWGSMGIGYKSPLVFIRGRLNGDRYIEEILRPIVLPLINEHAVVVFEQDNARSHIAQHAEVENLPWRARVPFSSTSQQFGEAASSPTASLVRKLRNVLLTMMTRHIINFFINFCYFFPK
jgi:hypothetical protein